MLPQLYKSWNELISIHCFSTDSIYWTLTVDSGCSDWFFHDSVNSTPFFLCFGEHFFQLSIENSWSGKSNVYCLGGLEYCTYVMFCVYTGSEASGSINFVYCWDRHTVSCTRCRAVLAGGVG